MGVNLVKFGNVWSVYTEGAQTIEANGSFDLLGYTVFELDPTIYNHTGTYTLVDYSATGATFNVPVGYANEQAAINDLVTVDVTDLIGLTTSNLYIDTFRKRLTVTLSAT